MIPRYRYRHDDGAEDQEPHRVRRRYDVIGELVNQPSKLAWKITTSNTLLAVTL
jgi:hypothetical protein